MAPISGILCVDKPAGWTSHDVVARVRRVAGQRQVGHAGTLDPLATGVLLVVLGAATKVSSYLMDTTKVYRAQMVLGATTVTDDAEAPLATRADISGVTRQDIESCLRDLTGTIEQIPPAYAAVRHQGQKLYALARKGIEVAPEPRAVRIDSIDLEAWSPPRLDLRITCGSGTYIRSLARDIGAALGVGGYLHALRRMASGSFDLHEAMPLEALTERESLVAALAPVDRALVALPAAVLNETQTRQVYNGQPVRVGGNVTGTVRLYGPGGRLVGLGEGSADCIKPFRVLMEAKCES